MSLRFSLTLAITSLLAASGCARSAKVTNVHLEKPGTHIVSGDGAVSVARNSGETSRVCTRLVPQSGKPRHGKPAPMPGRSAEPAAHLDVLLFRLCEARGNGDISAAQYAAAVQAITKAMEEMASRPRGPVMARPGAGPQRPGWGAGPGREDGERPARRRMRWWGGDSPPAPAEKPEPPKK
ncbi:MAG: hypothetical protein KF718_15800 [Polyangiaceae bacterium]|nr:hypothetical protein [Polyangiaceae bacterium]